MSWDRLPGNHAEPQRNGFEDSKAHEQRVPLISDLKGATPWFLALPPRVPLSVEVVQQFFCAVVALASTPSSRLARFGGWVMPVSLRAHEANRSVRSSYEAMRTDGGGVIEESQASSAKWLSMGCEGPLWASGRAGRLRGGLPVPPDRTRLPESLCRASVTCGVVGGSVHDSTTPPSGHRAPALLPKRRRGRGDRIVPGFLGTKRQNLSN